MMEIWDEMTLTGIFED